jgi:hypothetical protein
MPGLAADPGRRNSFALAPGSRAASSLASRVEDPPRRGSRHALERGDRRSIGLRSPWGRSTRSTHLAAVDCPSERRHSGESRIGSSTFPRNATVRCRSVAESSRVPLGAGDNRANHSPVGTGNATNQLDTTTSRRPSPEQPAREEHRRHPIASRSRGSRRRRFQRDPHRSRAAILRPRRARRAKEPARHCAYQTWRNHSHERNFDLLPGL